MKKVKAGYDERLAARTEKGLILVYTGDGKGKSTAAFGMLWRALHWGLRCAVVQFIKGASETGEHGMAQKLGIEWHRMGAGFSWETQDKAVDRQAASAAWKKSKELLHRVDFLVLDELNVAVSLGQLPIEPVLDALKSKPGMTHVVITGRGADPRLLDIADVVTEMRLVKHAWSKGVNAQKGVEF